MFPAVALANDLACKGLDKIEKTLPILHQPSEQVCSKVRGRQTDYTMSAWANLCLRPVFPNHCFLTNTWLMFVPVQIVSSAKDVVTSAKDVMTGTVSGAKDTVSDTLTSAVEKTRGAVQGGVERTRAVVSGSVSTVLDSRVARLVSSGVDSALSTSESLVDQYLPLTEDELGEWDHQHHCSAVMFHESGLNK